MMGDRCEWVADIGVRRDEFSSKRPGFLHVLGAMDGYVEIDI